MKIREQLKAAPVLFCIDRKIAFGLLVYPDISYGIIRYDC